MDEANEQKVIETRFLIEFPSKRDTKCQIFPAPVTGHTIKFKVEQIVVDRYPRRQPTLSYTRLPSNLSNASVGEGHAHPPYRVFRQQGDREIAVREQEEFNEDLKIVVRFENDPMITLNRCRQLFEKIHKHPGQDSDLMSLNSGNRVPVLIKETKQNFKVVVLLSNPLITEETYKGFDARMTSESRRIFMEQELLKPQKYDREPEIKAVHEKWWRLRRVGAKVMNAEAVAVTYKRKHVQVMELHCDVEQINKESYLLLEDETNLGVEKKVKAAHILSKVDLKLLVIVGLQATKVRRQLASDSNLTVIAINSIHYWDDVTAQTFLAHFYDLLFEEEGELTQPHIQNCFKRVMAQLTETEKEDSTINKVCCCLHGHQQHCQFMKLAMEYGLHTVQQF